MRRDAFPLLGFAAVLAVLDALLWSYGPTRLAGLLLALPAVAAVLAAAVVGALADAPGAARTVPELSLSTVLLAVGCVIAAAGAVFGLWLALIGGGIAVAALAGIVRELRAAPGGPR